MYDTKIKDLRSNQHFLVWELERRGIEVEVLDRTYELLEARYGGHRELLLDIDSSIMSYPAATITNNKYLAKCILQRHKLRVPKGKEFFYAEHEEVQSYAEELGYPVVLKPSVGANGDEVHINLRDSMELEHALDTFVQQRGEVPFVVEEFFKGEDYRVFITKNGDCAVLHRFAPSVLGDGILTIAALVERENERRKVPGIAHEAPILLDHIADVFLRKLGKARDYVPSDGEEVCVRPNVNVGSGGGSIDCTDDVDESLLEIAERALESFPNMPYAGVDILSQDGTVPQSEDSYRILEVNPLPSIGIHMMPIQGHGRNVAGMIVDLMFPETMEEREE